MVKKKVFLPVFVMLVVTLIFAGCGSSSQGTSETPSEAPEQPAAEGAAGSSLDSLTLVGGSAQGLWTVFGEGVGTILRQKYPGTQFSYETGSGVTNVINVTTGEVPLGLAFNFEVSAGVAGKEPYHEALPDVKVLTSLFNNQPYHMILSKAFADKYGIASFEDIVEKKPPIRVSTLPRGILAETVARTVFEKYGFTYDDIKSWGGEVFHENVGASFDMIKNGQLDYVSAFSFGPDGKLLELATTNDVVLLSLNDEVQKAIAEEFGTPTGVIPAGTYEWQTEDVTTNNAGLLLVSDPNMSDDQAYSITKALVENIDTVKSWHNSLSGLTKEDMVDLNRELLHPGALKYYEEEKLIQ